MLWPFILLGRNLHLSLIAFKISTINTIRTKVGKLSLKKNSNIHCIVYSLFLNSRRVYKKQYYIP